MAQGDRFDSTNSKVNNSQITKDKKAVFAPREAQFSDKKSKKFVIIFAILIFNQFQHKSRTTRSDRFAFYLHNVNKCLIAILRYRSWSFIQKLRDNYGLNLKIISILTNLNH